MLDTSSATDHQEIDTELIFERHVVTGKLVLSRIALSNIVGQSVAIICVKKWILALVDFVLPGVRSTS